MKKAILIGCAGLLFALPAAAKDLTGMVGLGFTRAFSASGETAVSARYWVDKQLGVEGIFGYLSVSNDDGPDRRGFDLGGRLLVRFLEEQNLNLYGGAGVAFLHAKEGGDSENGLGVSAFAGAEFFLQGLPNLGFSTEVGVGLLDSGDTTTWGTTGGSFVDFGIRYYF